MVELAETPILPRDVAFVQIGPEMRRGIAELVMAGLLPMMWGDGTAPRSWPASPRRWSAAW